MKPNNWDRARKLRLSRKEPGPLGDRFIIEPGVNFFVAMLEQIGCVTYFSCQGHPKGFYVNFRATYSKAVKINQCGFFSVDISSPQVWNMHLDDDEAFYGKITRSKHERTLRWAADAWEKGLGKLDWQKIRKKI